MRQTHGQHIEYIEHDGLVRTSWYSQDNPPSWGLSRTSYWWPIDPNNLRPYYYPNTAGAGADVYIIDTGIEITSEFGGRATALQNFVTGESNVDLNGHGTFCAGVVGSDTDGVAKEANIFAIKVLDQTGTGYYSTVIAGIQAAITRVQQDSSRPNKSIISMSLGGPQSQSLDAAVTEAFNAGIAVIVAAGNESVDACTESPSGGPSAFAVGAADNTDTIAYFSNFGQCVKVFAPGVDIVSLNIGGPGSIQTLSGTSMATPHVAGVAALWVTQFQFTPAALYQDLAGFSAFNTLQEAPANTTTSIMYSWGDYM